MFEISGNAIRVISGDTGEFSLTLNNYTFKTGDKVYFTVKKTLKDTQFVSQVVVTEFVENSANFYLSHEDTNLPEGRYIYDIQCSLADGRIDTVVLPSPFIVQGGVTDDR